LIKYPKLRGRIYEKFSTIKAFSEALGTSCAYVSKQLNGNSFFTQKSMRRWADLLDIPIEKYYEYFFYNQS